MIKIKAEGELLNYEYLQVPQCNYCGSYISKMSVIKKDNWQCHICKRMQKLPVWYKERPIELDQYQIVLAHQKFVRRCAFLIDVTSLVLCRMIIPLIEQSLNQFDEIVIIPCTPYPTIIEHKTKIKLISLLSLDLDYKIEFLNCERDFLKIRQHFRMVEKLSQYHHNQDILKNNYPIELGQQIINKLHDYQQVKIIHFAWINNFLNPQIERNTQLKEIKIGKNHYHLFYFDETNSSEQYYSSIVKNLHGTSQVFNFQDLDGFYQQMEEFFSSQFCWESQIFIRMDEGLKVEKFQEELVENNQFYLPYLTNQEQLAVELINKGKNTLAGKIVQTSIVYISQNKKYISVNNISL